MTTSPRRPALTGVWPVLIVLLALSGCRQPAAQIELIAYDDPYFPETSSLKFAHSSYHLDASGDLHIACALQEPAPGEQNPTRRLLHVHVFWPVRPGLTFADKTGINATIRYLVAGPQGSALYTGTGFVYCRKSGGKRISAALESGRLRLQTQSGTPAELRDARISGKLRPQLDGLATVDLIRELELCAGIR